MRVTTKGQVTIPQEVREKLGIFPGTEVDFIVQGDSVALVKAKSKNGKGSRGRLLVDRLAGSGNANLDLTTDQIMAWTRGWDDADDPDRQ
jgi:AbrB family looped-hinge helix DNA binding protein